MSMVVHTLGPEVNNQKSLVSSGCATLVCTHVDTQRQDKCFKRLEQWRAQLGMENVCAFCHTSSFSSASFVLFFFFIINYHTVEQASCFSLLELVTNIERDSLAWWCIPLILALRSLEQEEVLEFEVIFLLLDCLAEP